MCLGTTRPDETITVMDVFCEQGGILVLAGIFRIMLALTILVKFLKYFTKQLVAHLKY